MGVEEMIVRCERLGDGLALVTLNRPDKRNAVNPALAIALEKVVEELERDASVKAVVLTGAGPVFCAGADLAEVAAGRLDDCFRPASGFAGFVNSARSKPWIAAVNGPAFAGGFEIALACEMVLAVPDASFALPEVRRGLIASAGGLYRLPRGLPRPIALELILTGQPIEAARAFGLGLINRVVERDALLDEAARLGAAIAANAPLAVRESLRLARLASGYEDAALRNAAESAQAVLQHSADYAEGARAFVEKRPPRWTGA